MKQDEIIAMARHADREWDCDRDMFEWLETFAKQVAEREREASAKELDEISKEAKNVAPNGYVWKTIKECAAAIRARGQQ